MKSAYELAMERSDDGDGKPLTDQQKEQIAEIDSKYKAKIAERKIVLEKSVQDALRSRETRGSARSPQNSDSGSEFTRVQSRSREGQNQKLLRSRRPFSSGRKGCKAWPKGFRNRPIFRSIRRY